MTTIKVNASVFLVDASSRIIAILRGSGSAS